MVSQLPPGSPGIPRNLPGIPRNPPEIHPFRTKNKVFGSSNDNVASSFSIKNHGFWYVLVNFCTNSGGPRNFTEFPGIPRNFTGIYRNLSEIAGKH